MSFVMVANPSANMPPPTLNQQQLIFDFTKRKRWADLLISELTEAIMLVLSQTGQVWYCGPAVKELLGWKDEEVIDTNISDIMNPEDRATFQRQFTESIQNHTELLAYARLQSKTSNDLYPNVPAPHPVGVAQPPRESTVAQKEVLFEIKGYAHFIPSSGHSPATGFNASDFRQLNEEDRESMEWDGTHGAFRCFFAVAKPYPSRNTAMLNTLLELKMENEQLQARLQAAKAQAQRLNISTTPPALQRAGASTANSATSPNQQSYRPATQPFTYGFHTQLAQPTGTEAVPYSSYEASGSGSMSGTNISHDDDSGSAGDSSHPRKKNKRSVGAEMYVCTQCGTTGSPEWRKGPQGPKTLCNACGLRWAKLNRGPKEPSNSVPTDQRSGIFVGISTGVPTGRDSSLPTSTDSLVSPTAPSNADRSTGGGPGAPYMTATLDYASSTQSERGQTRKF